MGNRFLEGFWLEISQRAGETHINRTSLKTFVFDKHSDAMAIE
jgi:hypothetical protein